MLRKPYTPSFGSISSGTMRAEDLIPALADELKSCIGANGSDFENELVREAEELEDYESEDADGILEDLFDALNDHAPAYGYFGANDGDGADYGFWLSEGFHHDFGGLKVFDTSEVPADYSGEVLHVKRGDCTLYVADGGALSEIWSAIV
jgi:hypothetical protein